jgi:hypothetical protein
VGHLAKVILAQNQSARKPGVFHFLFEIRSSQANKKKRI